MDSNIKEEQKKAAATCFPPPLAEVFQKIESPFVQAITENITTKSVFMDGKVILVGDTVSGLRPHTGAGTAQAAMSALLLKKVFGKMAG
jgi:2-polyprenyl-6-methoxyphenol hydroxylase-like FAD-dependent oxidoreductase